MSKDLMVWMDNVDKSESVEQDDYQEPVLADVCVYGFWRPPWTY